MAVSANPPLLTSMPPAPLPTDAEAVFDEKAGASLTAQDNLVDEQNLALTWQAGAMAETKAARDAAAQSSENAGQSATAASRSATAASENGAQQVSLAVTARQGAEAAQASTVALAAAVAAGALPPFVDGLDVLQAKPDKTGVQWGKVGQAIGDVLETSRVPDATYLLPDTVYSRAAYPALFAVLGTQGEKNDGANLTAVAKAAFFGLSTFNVMHMATGKDGVVIAVGYNTALGGYNSSQSGWVMKSTDFGATWATVASFSGGYACYTVDTDNAGVWCVIDFNSKCYRSSDNGVTWSSAVPVTGLIPVTSMFMACNRKGVWIACLNANSDYYYMSRSVDNGLTWQQLNVSWATFRGIYADYSTGDFWLMVSQYNLYKTVNGGLTIVANAALTWQLVFGNGTSDGLSFVAMNAGVTAFSYGNNLYITRDNGDTYKVVFGIRGVPFVDPFGIITVNNNSISKWFRSYDYGETWLVFSQAVISTSPAAESGGYCVMYNASNGAWLMPYGSTQFHRSTRLFNYDVATQFKTPARKAPKGYKAYIKGKLQ